MKPRPLPILAVGLLMAAAFLAGRGGPWLEAQGTTRGPTTRQPPPNPDPITISENESSLLVYEDGGSGMSSAANGMIAVTGSYGVGTQVLYLIDTTTKQLAVYEARGGSGSMRRLIFLGARRISLDLQLEGYNDQSEFSYAALQRRFEGQGLVKPADAAAKDASDGGR